MATAEQHAEALRPILDRTDLTWTVEQRTRKTAEIKVRPGRIVTIIVPTHARPDQITPFVATKLPTITRKAAQLGDTPTPAAPAKELVNGEGFPLLGTNHKLRIVDNAKLAATATTVSSWSGAKIHELHVRRDTREKMRRAIVNWYRRQGREWAQRRGAAFERRGGIDGLSYEARDLGKRRWGVYQPRKHLVELHWPLLQLPEELAMYTLVHEIAHASRPGGKPHGPEWQRVMDRWLPQWRDRKQEKSKYWTSLWVGDVRER